MHKGIAGIKNDKEIRRIYYNSKLGFSESEFPFRNIEINPPGDDLKHLKANFANYKEKLQNKFQKCREYLKDISGSNSSGILKEIIIDQMSLKNKKKFLKEVHRMGLKIRQANAKNETLLTIDLSPIKADKVALSKFMAFIDAIKEKQQSETFVNDGKFKKSQSESENEENYKGNRCVHPQSRNGSNKTLLQKSFGNSTTKKTGDSQKLYNHHPAPSTLRLNSSIKNKIIANKGNHEKGEQSLVNNSKHNEQNKENSKQSSKVDQIKSLKPIISQIFLENSKTIDDNLNDKKQEKKKINKFRKMFGFLKNFQLLKGNKDFSKDCSTKPNKEFSILAYPVGVETKKSYNKKRITFSPSVISRTESSDKNFVEPDFCSVNLECTSSSLIVNEEDSIPFGAKKVHSESKKEIKLKKKKKMGQTDIGINQNTSPQCNTNCTGNQEKDKEVNKIMEQQSIIRKMIECIHDKLGTCETSVEPSKHSVGICQSKFCSPNRNNQTSLSENNCGLSWSDRATISNETCRERCYDSMTNIPNSMCLCPKVCEKIKSFCFKSNTDTNVECELRNQRRELARLNRLLENLEQNTNHR